MSKLEYALPAGSGEHENRKVRVAGLMFSCPVTQDNPCDCPLRAVRLLPLRARQAWLDSLRDEQLAGILDQHGECIVRKERENQEPA